MSMVGNLKHISPKLLNDLLQGEIDIEDVLYGEADEDEEYNPPRYLAPEQVKQIRDALADISEEELSFLIDIILSI
jgi:hypothetical protein